PTHVRILDGDVQPGHALQLARLVDADEDHLGMRLAAPQRSGTDAPHPRSTSFVLDLALRHGRRRLLRPAFPIAHARFPLRSPSGAALRTADLRPSAKGATRVPLAVAGRRQVVIPWHFAALLPR